MEIKSKGVGYRPGSTSFSAGFLGPQGDVGFQMIADEEKAKQIINKLTEDGNVVSNAILGLDGDFGCNHSTVYLSGKSLPYNAYPSSQWAMPVLVVEFEGGQTETFECWKR